jgi:hypothetical protein
MGTERGAFLEEGLRSMKLFNHVYLVARLRMGGKITSLSHVPLSQGYTFFFKEKCDFV